jgi:hypothetical protein
MSAPRIEPDIRMPPAYTRPFGCEELHAVFFQRRGDRGRRCSAVPIQVRQTEHLLKQAAKEARRRKAGLMLLGDTAAQAAEARERTSHLLPRDREISMARAEAGAWGLDG